MGGGGAVLGGEADEHPAGGPIDRDEQVLPLRLIGELREVAHIQAQIPRLKGLEGLSGGVSPQLGGKP